MDNIDRKILNSIQRDARTPISTLSECAGTSTASVQRRLKRLRESGVIINEITLIDPKTVGFDITAIIAVDLERDRLIEIDAFKRRVMAESQVQHCYCVAGDCDFTLIVIAKDMEDYEKFTHRFFFNDSNVRRFRRFEVLSERLCK
ncbi:MAG: Lrp/AsnC family transcriptional regulator [Rhizobiales bacterium]|nr:Lrp/AsnC family transcriptional regulator [Hyphomicrobiales bacterium]